MVRWVELSLLCLIRASLLCRVVDLNLWLSSSSSIVHMGGLSMCDKSLVLCYTYSYIHTSFFTSRSSCTLPLSSLFSFSFQYVLYSQILNTPYLHPSGRPGVSEMSSDPGM